LVNFDEDVLEGLGLAESRGGTENADNHEMLELEHARFPFRTFRLAIAPSTGPDRKNQNVTRYLPAFRTAK
jgi:hypothetical protein